MLKYIRYYLRHWLLIICIQSSYGLDDNQSWTSVGFEKKLPYSFKLQFEQELRLDNQLSTFKQTFSEFSLSYSVFKGFKIELPFRYMTYKDKTKQRVSFSGSYKYSFKPVSLKNFHGELVAPTVVMDFWQRFKAFAEAVGAGQFLIQQAYPKTLTGH